MTNDDLRDVLDRVKAGGVAKARAWIDDLSRCDTIFAAIEQLKPKRELHPTEDRFSTGNRWTGPGEKYKPLANGRRFEQAVQRAFLLGEDGALDIDDQKYVLIDAEVPTRPDGGGIDLLAMPVAAGDLRRAVIELKDAAPGRTNKGSSPVAALLQVVAYARDASLHERILRTHRTRRGAAGAVRFPQGWEATVVVAANTTYWEYWLDKLGSNTAPRLTALANRVVERGLAAHAMFVSFEDLARVPADPEGDVALMAERKHRAWKRVA